MYEKILDAPQEPKLSQELPPFARQVPPLARETLPVLRMHQFYQKPLFYGGEPQSKFLVRGSTP
jgi:hypothetical protein